MEQREFHSVDELHELKQNLATASQRPVYVSVEDEYNPPVGDEEPVREMQAGEVVELRDKSALLNERDNRVEYISSDEYELVQHADVLDTVEDTLERTLGDIEMGVIRDYGAQIDGTLVFANTEDARINVDDLVGDGYIPPEGEVDPYGNGRARDVLGLGMRIGNSFDGSKKVYASTMGYRFICQNWMVWGEEEIASTQSAHITEIDEEFFESVIEEVFEIRDDVSSRVRDSEEEEIPITWVPELLDAAGFGPNYQKRITGLVLRQEQNYSRGFTTSWRLYNAATTELDNNRAEDIGKWSYDRYQDRAWNLLDEPTSPAETWDRDEIEEFAIAP